MIESQMPTGKCVVGSGKPLICNPHSKDWFRQESSMDAKIR